MEGLGTGPIVAIKYTVVPACRQDGYLYAEEFLRRLPVSMSFYVPRCAFLP